MTITLIGVILLPLILILFIFCDTKYLFYLVFFFSAFTSTALIKFAGSGKSFQIYHVAAVFFIIKVFIELKKRKLSISNINSKFLFAFIGISFISIFYPLFFSGGTLVKTPASDEYLPVYFSYQNITQFLYLLLGYITYLSVIGFFRTKGLNKNMVINLLRITILVVLVLGIIQFVMPVHTFNDLFRNDFHSNDQRVAFGVRISAATMEASILALFITPIFIAFTINFFKNFKLMDLIIVILSILINVENGSSSFFVAAFIFAITQMLIGIFIKNKKSSHKQIIIVGITVLVFLILVVLFKDKLNNSIGSIADKLSGQGESGTMRKYDFQYHFDVFKRFIITGIGFGSVRSKDLVSTILADVGLLGSVPLVIYIGVRLYLLKIIGDEFSKILYALMFTTITVLFISVPEFFYLYIWIYFGIIDYFLFNENSKVKVY